MRKLLNEVKVLMDQNGYTIEEIKKVVDSFEPFFEYVSRNRLEKEFENYIGAFRNNILRRINGHKNAANIASVAEFNGTSIAATFIKSCIEKRVQSVLNGFLRSSEVYYNMACNSEGVDAALVLAQLSLDGIDGDQSIELTAPTTIIAFSTELNLKTLYSIKNYDAIVKNCYSKVTECVNGSYPNESILNDRLKMIELVSRDWKNVSLSDTAQNTMNRVRDSYSSQDKPVNLPDNDRDGNVMTNGHTLYKVFAYLPEEYQNMIKYQLATAYSRGDKRSLDDKVVSAIDYFLMISKLDTTMDNMDSTKQMVVNSNNFDRMRYLIDQLGSEELLFSMAYAVSSYIVAKSEVEGRSFSSLKNSDYVTKGLQYTEELDRLVNQDNKKKYLLDYITNNRQLLSVVKNLNSKDLYVLIDMFSLDEINWMKDSCSVEDSCSFKEMLYYCIFFKKHVNNYEFIYDSEKYKNINRLFYMIKSTNNLAMLGSQISQWFAEVNIYSLSQEEFEALKIFDNDFIYNSLSYKDRVLYKKCNDMGVPFKIYYTSKAYTSAITKYMDSPDFSTDEFEEYVGCHVNREFNKLIIVNNSKFDRLRENVEIRDLLIKEFGSIESIPNFLMSLPLSDIKVIIDYCKASNLSLRDWSAQMMNTPCFFCRTAHVINVIKSHYEIVKVRMGQTSSLDKINTMFLNKDLTFEEKNDHDVKPLADMSQYLSTVYDAESLEYEVEIEKTTDEDLLNYLLSNGVDFLTASYLQKNASRETIDKLLEYTRTMAIPKELLSLLGSSKVSIDQLLEKNQFFVSHGCRLDDVPVYYYTAYNISFDTFEKLFHILNGIYSKVNIPSILLTNETDKVQILIVRLKEHKINIHSFLQYLANSSPRVLDNIDRYVYIYNIVRQIPVTSHMVIKPFDLVVADYEDIRSTLGYKLDNPVLIKSSLYCGYNDFYNIKNLCDKKDKEFYSELLYFDVDFIKEFLDTAHICILSYRMTQREFGYEDACNLMRSCGWGNNKNNAPDNVNKGRKVA